MIYPLILVVLTIFSKASDLGSGTATNSFGRLDPETHDSYMAADIPLAHTSIDDLKQNIKSEPVPHLQTGPVTIVVGHNYNDIVLDENKDVLLMYYNPSCPPCQKVTPIYEELGRLSQEYADRLVVAKVDETINEVPDDIFYYPCFKLFPSGSKDLPIELTKTDDSLESLAHFIRDHGFHKIDILRDSDIHDKGLDTEIDFGASSVASILDYTLMETLLLPNSKDQAVKGMKGDKHDEL